MQPVVVGEANPSRCSRPKEESFATIGQPLCKLEHNHCATDPDYDHDHDDDESILHNKLNWHSPTREEDVFSTDRLIPAN